jgi:hypothetical protein
MANKKFFAGMLAMALTFGLILAGCPTEDDSPKGEYHLKWGAVGASYSMVAQNSSGTTVSGSDLILLTGSAATTSYNKVDSGMQQKGDEDGSFEKCRDFSTSGVSAPAGLKTAIDANKGKVPLAGYFSLQGGSNTMVFYITKN